MFIHLLSFSLISRRALLSSAAIGASTEILPPKIISPSIYFYTDVTPESCAELVEKINLYSDTTHSEIPINLHIQSRGGSAISSFHVSDVMRQKNVNTYIDGMAASAASIISVSGKKRFMTKHSFMLIHQPSIELGHTSYLNLKDEHYNLEKIVEALTDIYEDCSFLDRKQLKKIMFDEKYLTAQECLRYGLVDQLL